MLVGEMTNRTRVHAVVLAAGSSRRLGAPKQLARAFGESLLARAVHAVADASSIRIVAGRPDPAIDAHVAEVAASAGARVLRSAAPDEGMAASIRAAAADLVGLEGGDGVLFAVVDQLALSRAHVVALLAAFDAARGVRPVASRYDGVLGVPAIFPASSLPELARLAGDAGARGILRSRRDVVAVDLRDGARDVDVPSDLEGAT